MEYCLQPRGSLIYVAQRINKGQEAINEEEYNNEIILSPVSVDRSVETKVDLELSTSDTVRIEENDDDSSSDEDSSSSPEEEYDVDLHQRSKHVTVTHDQLHYQVNYRPTT